MDEPASVLVIANETLVGGELVAAVERRAAKARSVSPSSPLSRSQGRGTSCTATRGGRLPAVASSAR